MFGLGRYGRNLAQELRRRGRSVLGVDYDPERVRFWNRRGLATLCGDLEDAELFHALPLADAQWVVSTIPERDKSMVLLPYRDAAAEAVDILASHGEARPERAST